MIAALDAQAEPGLRIVSNVIWKQPDAWFGGFSGAEVDRNGSRISLVTDQATFVTATMVRRDGALINLQDVRHLPLKDDAGVLLEKPYSDSEGLAIAPTGEVYVAFERDHRVAKLDPSTGITTPLPRHEGFAGFGINKGLEALAIHPDGTLYAIPEKTASRGTAFPLFARNRTAWSIVGHIPRKGPFLVVGADFGPNGLLYLLERAATPLGFRTRIRRFNLAASDLDEQTLLTTFPARFDNMEAISVWQNKTGDIRITLISDDNFFKIQSTQIVEFALTE